MGRLFVIAIYVDDFLLFSSDIDDIRAIKSDLKGCFDMKDLDQAKWILQMKIERTERSSEVWKLLISQEHYVKTILEQHGMARCNPVKTPMTINIQLPVLTKAEVDVTEYQGCIGSLMYLIMCMRPDIAFAVGVLSCHVTSPRNVHMLAVKYVFQYLRGTSKYRLVFCANNSIDSPPIAYVDSDWAGDRADRKSILGYTILLNGGAISWGLKKQSSVSLSTVEAEFIATSTVVKEVLGHRALFCSLNMTPPDPTRVLIDNQGVLDLIKYGQINDYTKHIDMKF